MLLVLLIDENLPNQVKKIKVQKAVADMSSDENWGKFNRNMAGF